MLILTITNFAVANFVQETCTKITKRDPIVNVNFCLTKLSSDLSSETATTLPQLGLILLRLGVANAASVKARVMTLLQKGRFDKYATNCLKDCLKLYSEVTSLLRSAAKDFNLKDYLKANIDVTGAMDNSGMCEDSFGERKEMSPLTKENKDFYQLAAISLSISAMLRS